MNYDITDMRQEDIILGASDLSFDGHPEPDPAVPGTDTPGEQALAEYLEAEGKQQ